MIIWLALSLGQDQGEGRTVSKSWTLFWTLAGFGKQHGQNNAAVISDVLQDLTNERRCQCGWEPEFSLWKEGGGLERILLVWTDDL